MALVLARRWDFTRYGGDLGQVLAICAGEDGEVVALVDEVGAQASEHVVVEAAAGLPRGVDVFAAEFGEDVVAGETEDDFVDGEGDWICDDLALFWEA